MIDVPKSAVLSPMPRFVIAQELYAEFVLHMMRVCGECRISCSYFNRVWREYRGFLEPKTGGDIMKCTACIRFRDILHGAPGIRKVIDARVRARVEEERAAHHKVR